MLYKKQEWLCLNPNHMIIFLPCLYLFLTYLQGNPMFTLACKHSTTLPCPCLQPQLQPLPDTGFQHRGLPFNSLNVSRFPASGSLHLLFPLPGKVSSHLTYSLHDWSLLGLSLNVSFSESLSLTYSFIHSISIYWVPTLCQSWKKDKCHGLTF